VASGRADSRGTFYAAVALLELLGVRFLTFDHTAFLGNLPLALPDGLNASFHPPLEFRETYSAQQIGDQLWTAIKRGNHVLGQDGSAAFGGGVVYASPPGFVHTSYAVLGATGSAPPPALFQTHNAWFWPHNDPNAYGQLCWSNASLIAFVTTQVLGFLRTQPNATIISVSQNDNQNYCRDPAELAIIAEEGSPMGPLLRAVNQIADGIREEFPRVAVDTLAYQYTRTPPRLTVPRPNVIIRLCSIECNFDVPLTDPSNAAFQADMVGWSHISNRTFIWNYITSAQGSASAAFLLPRGPPAA
jgi:hypothetical protein